MNSKFVAVLATAVTMIGGQASAQIFTYVNSPINYAQNDNQSTNLNTGASDYVFYTYGGETQTYGASYTTGGTSEFNPVLTFGTDTKNGSSANSFGYNGPNAKTFTNHNVTYTGGYQYNYTLTGSSTAVGNTNDNDNGGTKTLGFASVTPQGSVATTQSISSSIQLSSTDELFTFYVEDNDTAANFAFTLSNLTGVIATSSDNGTAAGPIGGDNYGSFTLALNNAAVGDTLSYIETPDLADYSDNGFVQVGLVGVTAAGISAPVTVPEPSTYAFMALGFGALVIMVRRRQQAVSILVG